MTDRSMEGKDGQIMSRCEQRMRVSRGERARKIFTVQNIHDSGQSEVDSTPTLYLPRNLIPSSPHQC